MWSICVLWVVLLLYVKLCIYFRNDTDLSDITILSKDMYPTKAHRVVLRGASAFFASLLPYLSLHQGHAVVVVNYHQTTISSIMDLIYLGEVILLFFTNRGQLGLKNGQL